MNFLFMELKNFKFACESKSCVTCCVHRQIIGFRNDLVRPQENYVLNEKKTIEKYTKNYTASIIYLQRKFYSSKLCKLCMRLNYLT